MKKSITTEKFKLKRIKWKKSEKRFYLMMLSCETNLCRKNGAMACFIVRKLSISLLCNGWTLGGAICSWSTRADSRTLIWSKMTDLRRFTCGSISGFSLMNSGVRNASRNLIMPPMTVASMLPCRRMVNGLMFRFGSAVCRAINLRISFSLVCTHSHAYCTGGMNSIFLSTTSNHLKYILVCLTI